jgi:hypothetical protein
MAKYNVGLIVSAKDLASGVIQKISARTIALAVAVGNLASKMVAGAVNGVRRWIDEALEAEKANVMLDAALRGTGQYTEELSVKMRDLANAIQNETGASDESVKANISLLTTLGVATDKMGEAARAVQALAALNFDGSMAAKAVALAMEGNMIGFQRLIPALRNAKTETEKVEAVNKVLAAGYAQQKANLNTVGGAWEALKGRIGDAREDIVGAVFEGLKLGETFDGMQASLGRFLKSDSFKEFTDRLKGGAAYVKQIIDAMGTEGGTKEVLSAMGNVILAAFKDGGDYVKDAITSGFTKWSGMSRATKGMFGGLWKSGAMPQDRAAGVVLANLIEGGLTGIGKKSNLETALAKLNEITQRRVKIAETTESKEAVAKTETGKQTDAMFDLQSAREREAQAAAEKAGKEDARNQIADDIKSAEEEIKSAAEREQSAKDEIADIEEERAGLLRQNISEWIKNQQEQDKDNEETEKENRKAQKKAQRLRNKRDAGTHLSKADESWLNKFDKLDLMKREGGNQLNAAQMAEQAQADQSALNQKLATLQEEQKTILQNIETYLKGNLEVQ